MSVEEWNARARARGERCVADLSFDDDFEEQTEWQWNMLSAVLMWRLDGIPGTKGLDFGCGGGRFSKYLSQLIRLPVVGYDPCDELLRLAVAKNMAANVSFTHTPPHPLDAYGLIFIANVLGGIADDDLPRSLPDCLASNGLLFFAEHTDPVKTGSGFWRFRPEEFYLDLFPMPVEKIGQYETLGNMVSIFAGRKP